MPDKIEFKSQIGDFVQQLIGAKTKTGTETTSTQSSSADIDQLMQVFNKAMEGTDLDSDAMKTLISAIFTEGAQKIPELTGALANATGTRTTGNSGLALALEELNKNLSTAAASAMLTYKQNSLTNANNAASKIAESTKTTTTNENKNQTTQTGGGKSSALQFLVPFLVNQADKKGMLDFVKSKPASNDPMNVDAAQASPWQGPTMPPFSTPDSTPVEFNQSTIPTVEDVNFSDLIPSNLDLSTADPFFNPDSLVSDVIPTDVPVDTGDWTGITDEALASFGWKNGGKVSATGNSGQSLMRGAAKYADGGTVRNVNNMGAETTTTPLVNAINNAVTSSNSSGSGPAASPTPAPAPAPITRREDNGQNPNPGGSGGNGVTDASNTNGVVGTPSENAAAIAGMGVQGAALATGIPGLAISLGLGLLGINNSSMSPQGKSFSTLVNALMGNTGQSADPGVVASPDAVGGMSVPGAPGSIGMSTTQGLQDSLAQNSLASIMGDVSNATPDTAATSSAATGDNATSADGTAYKDGGKVTGGDGTVDSINAKLSEDEYVFPADVVRFWGTRTLDRMKNAMHQPV